MIAHDEIAGALGFEQPLSPRTLDRLEAFVALVRKWNPTINVIAKSTTPTLWVRHVLDSIQVIRCAKPEHRTWLDLGSGGGFPGIVVAVVAAELFPDLKVVLVESDKRKSVFLTQVCRQLDLSFVVLSSRIEDLEPQGADVVSARALAPLPELCGYAQPHLAPNGVCAFLKGANASLEIEQAQNQWHFDIDRVESVTDARSSVLFLKGLVHV